MKIIIRHGFESDAEKIREISLQLTIDRNTQEAGFVEYKTPSLKEMRARVVRGAYFYVAVEQGNSEKILGYIAGYNRDNLEYDCLDFSEDEIVKHILISRSGRFVYLDQLAVVSEARKSGVALGLMRLVFHESSISKQDNVFAAVAHAPHKNERSSRILSYFDFKVEEEIEVYNGLRFGIYCKKLNPISLR